MYKIFESMERDENGEVNLECVDSGVGVGEVVRNFVLLLLVWMYVSDGAVCLKSLGSGF